MDETTKEAMQEQLRLGMALRQKVGGLPCDACPAAAQINFHFASCFSEVVQIGLQRSE